MEQSILTSTKKVLGLSDSYTPFDLDILTHLNAAFATLHQLGIGDGLFQIQDDVPVWADYSGVTAEQLSLIKTYVYLKVRMLFDPPATSFGIEAANKQLQEYEWRISAFREEDLWIAQQTAE